MKDLLRIEIPTRAVDFFDRLSQLSANWSPPSLAERASLDDIRRLREMVKLVSWRKSDLANLQAQNRNKDSAQEIKILEEEYLHLDDELIKACWPWVDSSKKRGGKHFDLPTDMWYWVLGRVFREWYWYVVDQYTSSGIKRVEVEIQELRNLCNKNGSNDTKLREYYDKKRRELTKLEKSRNKQLEFLTCQPDVQVRALHWFLEWRNFDLSSEDILWRLGPGAIGWEAMEMIKRLAIR
jgi:hypothetical protein